MRVFSSALRRKKLEQMSVRETRGKSIDEPVFPIDAQRICAKEIPVNLRVKNGKKRKKLRETERGRRVININSQIILCWPHAKPLNNASMYSLSARTCVRK